MKYRVKLSMMVLVILGLAIAQVANANIVVKALYIDGAKINQVIVPNGLSFPYLRLTIGAEGNQWYRYNGLVGQIDEFALYDGVLSGTRILAHYNATPANYVSTVQTDNPRLYLRFEDPNANNGKPADNLGSISGVDGTYIGAMSLTAGKVGNAAVFHGASGGTGDCIDVSDTNGAFNRTDVTIEFWVKTTMTTDYPRFFQHNGANTDMNSYGAMFNASTENLGVIGGKTTNNFDVNSLNLNNGVWRHVVVTYDSTILTSANTYSSEVLDDDPCVYMQFGSDVMPMETAHHLYKYYTVGYFIPQATYGAKTSIGYKEVGGMGECLFLDNTPVWKTSGDGGWGVDGYAAITKMPSWGYDATSESYTFGNNNSQYDNDDDLSFEIWVKRSAIGQPQSGQYATIFHQVKPPAERSATLPPAPLMSLDSNNVRIACGSKWWYPGRSILRYDQNWHQLVVTYNEKYNNDVTQMQVQFYMDGSYVGSTVATDFTDANGTFKAYMGTELNHLMIGAANDRGWGYNGWAGYVDEFAIYPGILSAERIALHYTAWQPRTCEEVIERGYGSSADFNQDCQVNFGDFAEFALEWALCNDPENPACTPNW